MTRYAVEYVTRTQCPYCLVYCWSDAGGGGVICPCTRTEIQGDRVIRGGQRVTDEADFKRIAAADVGEPVENVDVREITR